MLLHQHRCDAVEGLLRVHCVTGDGVGWVEQASEHGAERVSRAIWAIVECLWSGEDTEEIAKDTRNLVRIGVTTDDDD
jgi:hypothetical protein